MKFLYKTLIMLTAVALWACSSDEPAKPEPPAPPEKAPRTLLVYMAANNSLGSMGYDLKDLIEMTTAANAGDLGDSRLLVYHHPYGRVPTLKEIDADGTTVIKEYDTDLSSVTSARMAEVIADVKETAPADSYGLVLWSHGNGWLENGIETVNDISPQTFGEDNGKKMNVTVLAKTLEGKGFDYIYFDCCLMSGIEVVYQLRNVTDFIVGSATELPLDGMPYDRNLKHLMAPEPDLISACDNTFSHYNALTGDRRTCTISLISTAGLDELADATASILATHPALPPDFNPQPYMTGFNCYLFDFKQYVEALANDPQQLARWQQAFDNVVIYKNQTPKLWGSLPLDGHSGLSTFITSGPSSADYRNYKDLDWWNDVVALLYVYEPTY